MSDKIKRVSLEELLKELEEAGVNKDNLSEIYSNPDKTKKAVMDFLNKKAGRNAVSIRRLDAVVSHFGIELREVPKSTLLKNERIKRARLDVDPDEKIYGALKNISQNDIIKFYNSGMSLAEICQTHGVGLGTSSRILKDSGIAVNKQIEWTDILKSLEGKDFEPSDLEDFYIVQNNTREATKQYLSELSGYKVGDKSFTKILDHFGLKKTSAQIAKARGAGARRVKDYIFKALKDAGFDSKEELAEFADKEKMTFKSVAEYLNEHTDKHTFTERWVARYISDLVDKKRRISRPEKELQEFVKTLISDDEEIIFNDRELISPKKLDIYIPGLKKAVEFNGNYWHSENFVTTNKGLEPEEFHALKFGLCKGAHDVDLVFVWEDDWVNNNDQTRAALASFFKTGEISEILMKF